MRTVSLIQIGDVHYPEHKSDRLGDIKDRAAPSSLVDAVSQPLLRAVMQSLGNAIDKYDVSSLLICGDLTSFGNLAEYDTCVDYLNDSLSLTNGSTFDDSAIHIVPGNHDVNRTLCDPDGKDLFGKFQPLTDSWDRHSTGLLAASDLRTTSIAKNSCELQLYSLNSCIGCGERRHIPPALLEKVEEIFNTYATSTPPHDAYDLVYEQLDTPAFVDTQVDALVSSIASLPQQSVPIILAHHNALPQGVPRIEIYTELINAGRFRNKLSSCRRPVIYCHGHIHDDPIERIVNVGYSESSVLFVSAPKLVDGFNVLTLHFGRHTLVPIGCEVIKFRRDSANSTVEQSDTLRVSLATPSIVPQFDDDQMKALLKTCTDSPTRFKDLRLAMNSSLDTSLQKLTVRDVVLEAEWLSLVSIYERDQPFEHWSVRRLEP